MVLLPIYRPGLPIHRQVGVQVSGPKHRRRSQCSITRVLACAGQFVGIPMRKIIFLDFDGVLHPDGVGLFSRLPVLESFLSRMPEVEVVVSSTWREDHTLEELREFFSPALRERISGVTPSLEDGYELGGRQKEIQSYLETQNLDHDACSWIALDDIALFFEEACPNLVLTDSSQGFTEREGQKLLEWYSRS